MIMKMFIRGITALLVVLSFLWVAMAAAPNITVTNPASDPATVTVNYVNVTVTTTGTTGIVYLKWDGGSNETMQGSGNFFYRNKPGLANGAYSYIVYANDSTPGNWTSSGSRTVNVNVSASSPSITAYEPSTGTVNSNNGTLQKFNITVDQAANVSWKIDGVEYQNLSVNAGTKSEYSNSTASNAGPGTYIVTATAINANGSSSPRSWTWNVITPTLGQVTALNATERSTTSIKWTWTNPGAPFNHTIVKINDIFITNTSASSYNHTSLNNGTMYTISLQTVDTSGNIHPTPVENQAFTYNTVTGSGVSVAPHSNVLVIFSQVDTEGNTTANLYSTLQSGENPHTFSKIGNYYYLATSAGHTGNITVELKYTNPGGVNESTIKLYRYDGGSWDDVTTSVDQANDKVRGNVTDFSPFVVGAPPTPIITKIDPNVNSVETIGTESKTFKIKVNQDANLEWKFGTTSVNNSSVLADTEKEFTYKPTSTGTYNFTVTATNANGSGSANWTWNVRSKTYTTGNRVWDGSKDLSTTYTWNPMSFYAFYYDVDSNVGNESLTIYLDSKDDRSIGSGSLKYSSTPSSVQFDHKSWGYYDVIGFMAKKYFAGYTSDTSRDVSDGRSVSPLSYNQLHEVLMDEDDQKAVYAGSTLTLGEGYVLKIQDVGTGRVVMLSLLKDGGQIDTGFVEAGGTYKYVKRVGSASDLPIIAVHVESVFQGRESNAAFIRGIFQISESYTSVSSNNRYGIMEITGADANGIEMENSNSFTLSEGSTIDIMGDVKFIVADSSVLRFAPMVKRSGTYEVRGTIAQNNDTSFEWTPMNFEGFYYNLDDDVGTEKLSMTRSGTSVPRDSLVYSTKPQAVSFEYDNLGQYNVIGFMAEKYFAGYIAGSITSQDLSTIGYQQLHKILIDDDTQRVVYAGSTLTLNEGYVLKIKDVNMGAGSAEVWLSLLKDGNEIDSSVKGAGEIFTYAPSKVGVINDLPIIAVRIENIFRGREATAAFMRGVFQISESSVRLNSGDRYGIMEVSGISDNEISMTNPSSFSLSSASTIDVMGEIKFKVADSSEIRFYPFVMANGSDISANELSISVPVNLMVGDTIQITVTAGSGTPIENAEVSFDGDIIGNTNSSGMLDNLLARSGQHTLRATKLGYETATKTVNISEFRDIALKFELPVLIDQGKPVTIKVISNGTAISGANVTFNGANIGLTDSSGILAYTFDVSGTHNLGASKDGYLSVVREITVRAPFTEFKALDINFTPAVVLTNQNYLVWANITNVGTKNGTVPVGLMVNKTVIESKNITLDPGAIQQINFTQKMNLPPGNYTVEILEQNKVMEVKEEPFNIFLIGGIVTVLGAVIIYLSTTVKGKATLDVLRMKFEDLIASARR
jgi:S-layer protein (TIGR01567 family)